MNSIAASEILSRALALLPFEPLDSQMLTLSAASAFAASGAGTRDVFVLNGYAGTGKTSLVGALIGALDQLRRPVVVLAPTGRAAKVASSLSSHPASTIHRRIFRPSPADPTGGSWYVSRNESRDTLFIVDEASLIGDIPGSRDSLLQILADYVYSAPGCKMILLGDEAQLPPVGQNESTAMSRDRLLSLGLQPVCHTLDVPVRQAAGSGIIFNATRVRMTLFGQIPPDRLALRTSGFSDVRMISSTELADSLTDSYSEAGQDETIIITRSNKRANNFNTAVRNMVMFAESPLERGDRVVVAKNDYFWAKRNKAGHLIANGDTAEITWVGKTVKEYGRYFTEAELRLSDGAVVNAQIMLRSLASEGPALPRGEMERFHNRVLDAYEGVFSEKVAGAMSDPYYNALQVKYAYCITCHKAQGGQWRHVYIDMGGISPDDMGPEFYRWLYTAMTRATERVYLINPTLPIE